MILFVCFEYVKVLSNSYLECIEHQEKQDEQLATALEIIIVLYCIICNAYSQRKMQDNCITKITVQLAATCCQNGFGAVGLQWDCSGMQ